MKYERRLANPFCNCGHAYYSHGTNTFNLTLIIMGSGVLWVFVPNYPWLFFINMVVGLGLMMIPWRKVCLVCKCPCFTKEADG